MRSRSSSVRLPHCWRTLPLSCIHCPFNVSRFIMSSLSWAGGGTIRGALSLQCGLVVLRRPFDDGLCDMHDDLPLVVQDPQVAPRHHDLLATHACHPASGYHDVPDCSGSRVDEELI